MNLNGKSQVIRNVNRDVRFSIVVSLCLAVAAILANPYIIVIVFRGAVGTDLELTNKIILWLFSVTSLLAAGLIYCRGKTSDGRKRIAFGFVTAILMIVLVELTLHAIFWVYGMLQRPDAEKLPILNHSAYRGKIWAKPLLEEWAQMETHYEPFLGWDRKQYNGKYINVDSCGVRKTWNAEFSGKKPKKIYMFGGSTLWGARVRDDFTIPSWVSKKLNDTGQDFEICNYGETGYVILQEIVHLALLLRDGHRPDYVLFYDGVNDVYAAYQEGSAGAVQNTSRIRAKLNAIKLSPRRHVLTDLKHGVQNNSIIYRAIERIAGTIEGSNNSQEVAALYSEDELKKLASEIVEHYAKSLALLENLSTVYGFEYICFWQPVTFLEDKLTEEEADSDDARSKDEVLGNLYKNVFHLLKQKPLDNHVIVADVLKGRSESVYYDFCHLTEKGNEMVADKIVDTFRTYLNEP